nr:Y+L amino acid transporter 2-like [Cherax quadricarinatus]
MSNGDELRMKNKEPNLAGPVRTTDLIMESKESVHAEGSTCHPRELHTTQSLSKHRAEQTEMESPAKTESKADVHKREPSEENNVAEVEDVSKKCSEELGGCGMKLKRELGLLDCVGFTLGGMIGSGIFVSPRMVLQYTGSVGMSLAVWVVSGAVAMCGAFCYTEMGEYCQLILISTLVYCIRWLNSRYGGHWACFLTPALIHKLEMKTRRHFGQFLTITNILEKASNYGEERFMLRFCILCSTEDNIVCETFVSSCNVSMGQLQEVKWAARVQNILALTKVLALIMIITIGIYYLVLGRTHNFDDVMAGTNWDPPLIATAFYQTFYTYSGCQVETLEIVTSYGSLKHDNVFNVSSIITDIRIQMYPANKYTVNGISNDGVTCIADIKASPVSGNRSGFLALEKSKYRAQLLVSTEFGTFHSLYKKFSTKSISSCVFGNLTMGVMAWTIPFLVACSTSGASNGAIFTNARVLFVSSRRGQMPQMFSHLHIHNHTPIPALFFVATITMVMFVTSDMTVLINYFSFASNLLELGTIGAFFWFRIKQPDRHRPIKVWIIFPIIYFIVSVFLTVLPVIRQPLEVMMAVIIIITGLPVYYFTIHRHNKPHKLLHVMDKVRYLCQMVFLTVPEEKTV